jgi:hypothetical protein
LHCKLLHILAFIICSLQSLAQVGGNGTYKFLELTNSARVAALGGNQISITDNDLDLVFHNPALLSEDMHKRMAINYVDYFTDIKFGYASYAHNFKKTGPLAIGIHFIDYGNFVEARENGEITGTFNAAEYALNIFWSRKITNRVVAGINIKPIYSVLEKYSSFGMAADFGITRFSKDSLSALSLVVKNIGTQLTTYYDNGEKEKLPWDIEIGYAKKLSHAPLRLCFTAQRLTKWDLSYNRTEEFQNDYNNGTTESNVSLLLRHIITGIEFLPSKNFSLRLGYNHQRRKELAIEEHSGLIGFSGGFGIKVSNLNINYGLASYHLAGTSHHFSLAVNLEGLTNGMW